MSRRAIVCPGARSGAALMALLMAGCEAWVEPTRFALGQKIPLGALTLTISHTESVSPDHLGRPEWRLANRGDPLLVVIFDAEGLESLAPEDVQPMFTRMLDLTDDSKQYHGPGFPLPRRKYYLSMTDSDARTEHDYRVVTKGFPGPVSTRSEWVVAFSVPEKSRGLTLLLKNLDHRQGQPRLAEVSLGR